MKIIIVCLYRLSCKNLKKHCSYFLEVSPSHSSYMLVFKGQRIRIEKQDISKAET